MQSLIRLGVRSQTRAAATNLQKLLEAAVVVGAIACGLVASLPALAADEGNVLLDGIWLPVAMEFAGQPFPEAPPSELLTIPKPLIFLCKSM